VTPGIPDRKSVYAATRGHYQQLLNAGVRIFEYTPGFMHAKMALCDKTSAVIGSINMDSRSFYHQYENAVWFTGSGAIGDMAADFEHIFTQCREIDAQTWARRPLIQRFVEATLCLMSPMF
jgi:cardiolipin synthase